MEPYVTDGYKRWIIDVKDNVNVNTLVINGYVLEIEFMNRDENFNENS